MDGEILETSKLKLQFFGKYHLYFATVRPGPRFNLYIVSHNEIWLKMTKKWVKITKHLVGFQFPCDAKGREGIYQGWPGPRFLNVWS